MRVFTCFLLYRIIAYAYSKEVQNTPTKNERSVNLVLETVLEFSDSDNSADIKFLDDVVNFITRVKSVIKDKNSRREFKTQRVESFTDFIQEVVGILNTYDDAAFQDFFDTLDEEIRKYHYRGCKFYELTDNIEIRKLIGTKLDLIRGKSVLVIKTYINVLSKLLREESYDDYVKELVDYINSLYGRDDRDKFNQVLSDLENYNTSAVKGPNRSLSKIISDGVRAVIFNHYTDLNFNARRELKNKIETFLKQYKHMASVDPKRSPVNVNIYKDGEKFIIRAVKKKTTASLRDTEENTREKNKYKEHNRSDNKRIDIKMSDYNNKPKSRFIIMRDGTQEQNVPYVEYVNDKIQDIETKLNMPSARKDVQGFQRTTKDAHIFSSDEPIDGASFESNSIEFFQEQMLEANTQRYMTLYPEEIIHMPMTTEKKENNIRAAKISTRRPKLHTLWIEESKGRLQKAVLDEMTTKPKPRHNKGKHVSKHWQKYRSKHGWKHGSKHAARHKSDNSEYKSKHKLRNKSKKHDYQRHGNRALSMKRKDEEVYNEHSAFSDNKKKTNTKFYDDEEMFEAERIDKHGSGSKWEHKSRSRITKPGPSRHLRGPFRPTRRAHQTKTESSVGISEQLDVSAERYERLTGKKYSEYRRNEPPSFKRTTRKQFDKYKKHKDLRKITKNKTGGTHVNMDPNFVKRIVDLEKELKEVKSKITGVDIVKVTTRKIMERYKTKDAAKIGINLEDKNSRATEMQLTNNEFKPTGTDDTRNEYRTEFKFAKGKDSKLDEIKEIKRIEIKHDVAQIISSKVTKMEENKNLTEVGNAACIADINSKCKEMQTTAVKTTPLLNYDMDDEQKDTKPNLRATMKSTASNATESTTAQTTTIKATTTEKPTEIKTTPTRIPMYKPVSMSFAQPLSTKPQILTSVHTESNSPIDYNDNMMKNPIDNEMENYFDEPHTKTMEDLNFKNNQNNNIINVTMPTVNTENLNATRSLDKEPTPIDLESVKDFTISSPPFLPETSDTTRNFNVSFLYTDPFSDLDNDLDFMKNFA